ncbi:MAG: hypothetical protein BWY87_00408 [Deltaproteobacteria bacterium ADurb.Bin510]|nr:MAG: hypothetical protein BWY87_00408 [Deltaproteobacteria bacterium ADurb.Bin510]
MRRIVVALLFLFLPGLSLADELERDQAAFEQIEPAELVVPSPTEPAAAADSADEALDESNCAPAAGVSVKPVEVSMPVIAAKVAKSGAQLCWVGGSLLAADETRPILTADLHAELGDFGGMRCYTQPLVSIQGQDPALSLGLGARLPVLNEQAMAGANLFFDWTGENHHRRLGLGGEFIHRDFAVSLNAYLPFSDRNGREEAIPGFDISVGVPIPGHEFLTVRPGAYYYNGRDEDDVKGLSLSIEAQPVEVLTLVVGARSDSLDNGRNEVQAFAQVRLTWPMRRLGRDIFAFKPAGFDRPCLTQRVQRESAITVERKTKPWDML